MSRTKPSNILAYWQIMHSYVAKRKTKPNTSAIVKCIVDDRKEKINNIFKILLD